MKKLPDKLSVVNKEQLIHTKYNRCLCYLRKNIYEFMLSRKSENEYFDFDDFLSKLFCDLSKEHISQIKNDITIEINNLGWKTIFAYGNTALFIYSSEKYPDTYYEGEF